MSGEACLFCRIVAGEVPATIVDEDDTTLSFMDISPANPGHALVIPKKHSADLLDIPEDDLAACAQAAKRLAVRQRGRLRADGINMLNSCRPAAWQTVFHFHIHVIPRYDGDPLRLPWTPSAGDPGEITDTAEKLRT